MLPRWFRCPERRGLQLRVLEVFVIIISLPVLSETGYVFEPRILNALPAILVYVAHNTQHISRMRRVSSFSEMLPTPRCCCSTCTTWIRPMVRINAGLCSATGTTGLSANCQRPMACGRVMLYVTAYMHILRTSKLLRHEEGKSKVPKHGKVCNVQ